MTTEDWIYWLDALEPACCFEQCRVALLHQVRQLHEQHADSPTFLTFSTDDDCFRVTLTVEAHARRHAKETPVARKPTAPKFKKKPAPAPAAMPMPGKKMPMPMSMKPKGPKGMC